MDDRNSTAVVTSPDREGRGPSSTGDGGGVGAVGTVLGVDLLARLGVLALIGATAVQSVLVPRGLYADGSYGLWLNLNTQDFVVIGPARTFAQLLYQFPLVLGMWAGVSDLDILIGLHSFGVAAAPVLVWGVALVLHLRGQMFWMLAATYAAVFLTSGFIAIGEYNYAFALSALLVSIITRPRALGWRSIVGLTASSLPLVLAYEGMCFLGVPLILLIGVRLFRRSWLVAGPVQRAERAALWFAMACVAAGGLVAVATILIRMQNSADTNLAGAMNVQFALENNRQWQWAASAALLVILSCAVRNGWGSLLMRSSAAAGAIGLFREGLWAPAWMHYNSRSLAAYTFTVLVAAVVVVVIVEGRRCARAATGPGEEGETAELSTGAGVRRVLSWAAPASRMGGGPGLASQMVLCLGAGALVLSMTTAFATVTHRYGLWLAALSTEVRQGEGIIEVTETDLYNADSSQFSWGWTNPYTSALLSTRVGQGVVISHVDTKATYTGISPPMSERFFILYQR